MKVIIATKNIYGFFGDLKKTIIYYEDGSKRVIEVFKKTSKDNTHNKLLSEKE